MSSSIESNPFVRQPALERGPGRLLRNALLTLFAVVFVGPGPFLVALPWYFTGWVFAEPFFGIAALTVLGAAILVVSSVALTECVLRFVIEGDGTPAPFAPPEKLVVTGLYQHVRNPMYLAIPGVLLGQALLFSNVPTLLFAIGMAQSLYVWVKWVEEPSLLRRHGATYATYCQQVRGWLPRVRAAQHGS